jgi:pilus assembly protein CpaB
MRLGSRAKLTIGIGLVAAGGFAYLGLRELRGPTNGLPQVAEEARAAVPQQVLLAAATRPIMTGETITADMIRSSTSDPARFPLVATPAEVIGKVATRDIPANTLIARNALDQDVKLAIRVPVGMRAISIDTTAEIAVAGLLRPGDRVDVQVVYPGADAISGARGIGRSNGQTLLQLVQVLAVGDTVVGTRSPQSAAQDVMTTSTSGSTTTTTAATTSSSTTSAPPAAVARTVTLALFPDQVSALSLAKSTGALYLSLRNPSDEAQPLVARAYSSGPLPQMAAAPAMMAPPPVLPQPARPAPNSKNSAPSAPARSRQAPRAIDLIVGGNHEIIYSGSGSR